MADRLAFTDALGDEAEPVALLGLLDRPCRVLHLALRGVGEQCFVA